MTSHQALRPWPKREPRDLTGERFRLVVVVRMAQSVGSGPRCWVRCDCGAERMATAGNLQSSGGPSTHRICNRVEAT